MTDAIELSVGERVVRVTSPDKVYFPEPGITKAGVVRYFLGVGDGILGAVRDRPTMLERWPGGRQNRECPDELRIDLDPQPGTGFRDAVAVAFELRGLLAEHGLKGFPKTSGGRGLHITVPILPRWTYGDVARAQEALARELVRRMPRAATMARFKRDRGERVYVDHGQFLVAAGYSIRPTARATVSAPVTWDELDAAAPEDFDVTTMPARFAALGDLHARLAQRAGSIEPLLAV